MAQRLVGLDDAAEERFRLLVPRVHLRVIPAGQPPIRPTDLAERRTTPEAEGDVEVHGRSAALRSRVIYFLSSTTSASITSPSEAPPPDAPAPAPRACSLPPASPA